MDNPGSPPLVGEATIVLVNDARHQLEANFLQRTVPYFFELSSSNATVSSGGRYRWAKVREGLKFFYGDVSCFGEESGRAIIHPALTHPEFDLDGVLMDIPSLFTWTLVLNIR